MTDAKREYTQKFIKESMAALPELMIDACLEKDRDEKKEPSDTHSYYKIDLLLEQSPFMTHIRAMELLEELPLEKAVKKARQERNPSRRPIDKTIIKHLEYPEGALKRTIIRVLDPKENEPKAKKTKKADEKKRGK